MKEQSSDIIDFKDLREFYERAYGRKLDEESLKELVLYDSIKQICDEIGLVNSKLKERSRTSKLWLLYMDYNYVAKEFTCAERTSSWDMHLNVLSKILNLFAGAGQINYLQQMEKLPETHPWLHNEFVNGNHTAQQTKRNSTGIWTYLAIKQTMIRSIKSRRGLTGGRSMTESVRHIWALSFSQMASVHDAMIQFSGVLAKSSEQHEEIGKSRIIQDYKDCQKIYQ